MDRSASIALDFLAFAALVARLCTRVCVLVRVCIQHQLHGSCPLILHLSSLCSAFTDVALSFAPLNPQNTPPDQARQHQGFLLRFHFSMSDPIDVTQSAEYLELLQVSEEMEADLMRQLAAKDAIIAEKQLESQAQITRLQADLVGRDKELEEFIAEVESTNNAALRAKDEEAAALKQALEEARDKRAAAEVQRSAADASLSVAKDRIKQLEAAANDAEEVAQQKQVEVHALQLQLQQLNASSAVCAVSFHVK